MLNSNLHNSLWKSVKKLIKYAKENDYEYDSSKDIMDYITNTLCLAHGATKDNMNETQLLFIRINES